MKYLLYRTTLLIFLLFLSSGCAPQVTPLNFSVPNVGPSNIKLDAELKSISVSPARPEESTGKLDEAAATITKKWENSLEEAFFKMAIFTDGSPRKISLSVKILKYDYPLFGISMTTHTEARYELIDQSNGDVIFTTTENSSGTVSGTYAFSGLTRLRESASRSVQNNILKFLQALKMVNFNKSVLPTPN